MTTETTVQMTNRLSQRISVRQSLISGMVGAMKKTTVAAAASALLVVGVGATAAVQAEPHHTTHLSPGCKLISRTQTQPVYSSLYDRTGIVTVTTVEKCNGQTITRTTSHSVTRTVKVPCGVHTPDAAYRPC